MSSLFMSIFTLQGPAYRQRSQVAAGRKEGWGGEMEGRDGRKWGGREGERKE